MAPLSDFERRFITPSTPSERDRVAALPRDNHDGNINVTGSVEEFATFEGELNNNSQLGVGEVERLSQRLSEETTMRSEVTADYKKIAEARKNLEFENAEDLARTASRMLTVVMGGREMAIADKELFWKVANEYFSKNDEKFDLEKVSRVYMNARTARLNVDGINDESFTGLVDLTNKQLATEAKNPLRSKDGQFRNFIQRRSIRTSSREFKENYGQWFNVQDKSTFKNLTNEVVTGSMQGYQRAASLTDVEILESLRGQDSSIVEEIAPRPPVSEVTREVIQAEDVLEMAADDFELGVLRQKIVLDAAEIAAQEARINVLEDLLRQSVDFLQDRQLQEILGIAMQGEIVNPSQYVYFEKKSKESSVVAVLWRTYLKR